ncbi:C209E-like protein, partial [Mya arenaria]
MKYILYILLLFAGARNYVQSSKRCPSGYTSDGNVCYKVYTSCKDWTGSRDTCSQDNGVLYLIADDETFHTAQRAVDKITNGGHTLCKGGVWLGAKRRNNQLMWEQDKGKAQDGIFSSYYASGQPDALAGEDCVEMRHVDGFKNKLNDYLCSQKQEFICQKCFLIDNCAAEDCYPPSKTMCTSCVDNGVHYKLSNDKTQCYRMCSFDTHKCWPGSCGADGLTSECQCHAGFKEIRTSAETKCKLTTQPSIEKCLTSFRGVNGELKQTATGICSDHSDIYGNYQPVNISVNVAADFTVPINLTRYDRPDFIEEERFGVVDFLVTVQKKTNGAPKMPQKIFSLLQNNEFSSTSQFYKVLCVLFTTNGGGYNRGFDFTTDKVTKIQTYEKTTKTEELCYRYDNGAPEHCLITNSCTTSLTEPLQITPRVTREATLRIGFDGWADTIPPGYTPEAASGIESYEIRINEVSGGIIVTTGTVFSRIVNDTLAFDVPLLSKIPKLYSVHLDVKDIADNIKQCRRFVLVDNSSAIKQSDNESLFYVSSASKDTKFEWQTHHS